MTNNVLPFKPVKLAPPVEVVNPFVRMAMVGMSLHLVGCFAMMQVLKVYEGED